MDVEVVQSGPWNAAAFLGTLACLFIKQQCITGEGILKKHTQDNHINMNTSHNQAT